MDKITRKSSEEKIKLLKKALRRGKQAEESLRVSAHQFDSGKFKSAQSISVDMFAISIKVQHSKSADCRHSNFAPLMVKPINL